MAMEVAYLLTHWHRRRDNVLNNKGGPVMRRFLFAAVLVLGLPSIHLFAQAAPTRTPVSGVVLNAGGRPLANAQVILQRHTFKLDSEGVEILAHVSDHLHSPGSAIAHTIECH